MKSNEGWYQKIGSGKVEKNEGESEFEREVLQAFFESH